MSKTYKDKANYARFHNRMEILDSSEAELADVMERHYVGLRSGNNRKYRAEKKVFVRRSEKAKEQKRFQRELEQEYDY